MIYLVGLGLYFEIPERVVKEIEDTEIYIDSYTSYVPDEIVRKYRAKPATREFLEEKIYRMIDKDISILVPGDPMFATTHSSIYFEALKRGIPVKVYHNSSILNAISRTGLSPYRFGRVVSVAYWADEKIASFKNYISQNQSLGLHTLVLPDPMFNSTEEFLARFDLGDEIFTLARVGFDDERIVYGKIYSDRPFSFVVPGQMSHYEREFAELLRKSF
ncbi:MAG: SAM-dependent methyltransferase [Candidatus Micrarchaeota archaeon]|nr:SAM-dependent methyltransferase [Candidatus Micrarchaeota archaeon]